LVVGLQHTEKQKKENNDGLVMPKNKTDLEGTWWLTMGMKWGPPEWLLQVIAGSGQRQGSEIITTKEFSEKAEESKTQVGWDTGKTYRPSH